MNSKKIQWDSYSACAAVEWDSENYTETEIISAWQYLIDTGIGWSMQGWYGRTMQALIDEGICHYSNKPTKDYYGNNLPVNKEG